MITYDILTLPMQTFYKLPGNSVDVVMSYISPLFWTFDLIASVLMAAQCGATCSGVIRELMRGGVPIFALAAFVDWWEGLMSSSTSTLLHSTMGVVRMVTVVCVVSVAYPRPQVLKWVKSNVSPSVWPLLLLCIHIVQVTFAIGLLVHLFACAWCF